MSMNSAPALSVVEHSYAPTADQELEYYNGIVNFLESEENSDFSRVIWAPERWGRFGTIFRLHIDF